MKSHCLNLQDLVVDFKDSKKTPVRENCRCLSHLKGKR